MKQKNPQWYVPNRPVINPNDPGKVRRVCDAASNFEGLSSNKSPPIVPDSLHSFIRIIIRFQEKILALSADIELMFLQVKVPAEDAKCLPFMWRENQADTFSTYEYTRLLSRAKDSPTCSNYAL